MAERPTDGNMQKPPEFTELNDLASNMLGTRIVFATDDWFAVAENLLKVEPPVFNPDAFTEYGKEMDGWETRRKRIPGHDWCIIQLGAPGIIQGVDIDTSFFSGNYSPRASIQATSLQHELPPRTGNRIGQAENSTERALVDTLNSNDWEELIPMTVMGAGYKDTCHNYHAVSSRKRYTHIRLNMFPDGGIARLRVYGQVVPDWTKLLKTELVDLASMLNGGICVGYSNVHYGHAKNMIGPGRSRVMADGWETARRLDRPAILEADENGVLKVPGSEWAAFKLGHPGVIKKIEIDTNHFKGNFPDSCWIEGCLSIDEKKKLPDRGWKTLLPVTKLTAHAQHYYDMTQLQECDVISHVRVSMSPDGGISRIRLWGTVEAC